MPSDTDLLLTNAKVITMSDRPARAAWIALTQGRISAMGSTPELSVGHLRPRRIVDCGGKTILPGFVDSHLHLSAMAKMLLSLNLSPDQGIHCIADLQAHIARRAQDTVPGSWIRGTGYHEFDLMEKRHPHRRELDQAAPRHPLIISHRTGHAHVLNSLGLALVGIDEETGDPDGGMIDRDLETGALSGLLYEMGAYVTPRLPPLSEPEWQEGIARVNRRLLAAGVTTLHDVSARNTGKHFRRLQHWVGEGQLAPRVYAAMGFDGFSAGEMQPLGPGPASERVKIAGVKIILDETTGRLYPDQALLNQWVAAIHHGGMQAIIHAVEEPAVAAAVTAIADALKQRPATDHRHRIEHCAVCPPDLAAGIAALGIRVVSQPGFLYFNGDRYLETVAPEKMQYLYPFATLIQKGIQVAGSSDAPVAPLAPLQAVQAAFDRTARSGRRVNPGEALTLGQALAVMTVNSAQAIFAEAVAGSLAIGRPADLIVLDGDLEDAAPNGIAGLQVETTLIDGRVVWQKTA